MKKSSKQSLLCRLSSMPSRLIKNIARKILTMGEIRPFVTVNISSISDNSKLINKRIVITGGSKGLGYSMARKFIEQGAEVIITGRNEDDLKKATDSLGCKCHYIKCDVSDIENISFFLEECVKCFNCSIDCLVCNAGISFHEHNFTFVTEDGFDKQFNTNLRGTYFLSKAFIESKLKEESKNASLLIISSETADMSYDIPYGLTKAALSSLTKALSRRVYDKGIRVNAIAPGVTLSEMTMSYAIKEDGNLYRKNAANRVFLPEEVAEVAAFLLSDASVCISGEIIHTNAGNHHRVYWE